MYEITFNIGLPAKHLASDVQRNTKTCSYYCCYIIKKSDEVGHKENMKIQFSWCSLLICIDIFSQWQSTFPFWASDNFSVF